MECSICIETKSDDYFFKCNACKYNTCVDCNKIYLLSSTQDPHCINCRAVIPYDIFLDKFNEKWIFNKYKKHRYCVLWDREKSLIPQTIHHFALKNQAKELHKKQDVLYEQIRQIQLEISNLNINSKKNNAKFNYTYACPKENCKGFLNKDYICEICQSLICKSCYIEINKDKHECDPELVETFNIIKKEAKPCPSCGEFISKISGCDQMFCTTCGTGFSWKTGNIEKGVIHNPHAHTFFQNNPDAQQNYLNAVNGNNGCRNPIPTHIFMEIISSIDKSLYSTLTTIHRRISEFRQYHRTRFLAILQNTEDKNLDIRMDYIKNIKDEKKIQQDLHRRDKKTYFKKQITQAILYAFDIAEIIFWNFHDAIPEKYLGKNISRKLYEEGIIEIISISEKHLNLINEIIADTNESLRNISDKFNYTTLYLLEKDFRAPYLS
jgi:hypothetical protein